MGGPWGWDGIKGNLLLTEIIPRLHAFESMQWAAVEGASGSHFVARDAIAAEARARLVELGIEADRIFSLRISGRRRIWGTRDVAILRVLWWDPDHTVCPSLKD